MVEASQIVVVLVLLNASAAFAGSTAVGQDLGVQPTTGAEAEIQAANESIESNTFQQSSEDELIGSITGSVSGPIRQVFNLVFAAPRMFINLGAPTGLVAVFAAPLYIVVGLNIFSILTGRDTL
jgi:hypothetical protein